MIDFKLYFVADIKPQMIHTPMEMIAQAVKGGADIVQLRYKSATTSEFIELGRQIKLLLQSYKIPFIINDRIDVALALDADGVHLGQDDMPVDLARKLLGKDKIIGKSTHNIEQALSAQKEDIDYLAIGPVFPTNTKKVDYPLPGLGTVREVSRLVKIPWLAIGGINENNLDQIMEAGAERIAVVSAIADAKNPAEAAEKLKLKLLEGKVK